MTDLLFLTHRIPFPPNKGDKLRSFNLLRFLSKHYRVHLGCFVDDPADWQHLDAVKVYCSESKFIPLQPQWRRLCSLAGLLSGRALSVAYYTSPAMIAWVRMLSVRHRIERVLVFSSAMAQFADAASGLRRVADMVDVDSAKWARYASDKPWPLSWLYAREARRLLEFETRVARSFDATVFVSAAEARLFLELSGIPAERVHAAANGVDTDFFKPDLGLPSPYEPSTLTLVFTGAMDYWPNVDAVCWFASEIFPRLRERWPQLRFAVVGARPTSDVQRLVERDGVLVTGTVPDVRPYIEHAAAVVAPLRIARGVQNKVLEGMAMGRTVIATPGAAEGLDVVPGQDLLVAGTSDEFLAAVTAVLEGRLNLGDAARSLVLTSYAWEANLANVRELLETQSLGADCVGSKCAAAA